MKEEEVECAEWIEDGHAAGVGQDGPDGSVELRIDVVAVDLGTFVEGLEICLQKLFCEAFVSTSAELCSAPSIAAPSGRCEKSLD